MDTARTKFDRRLQLSLEELGGEPDLTLDLAPKLIQDKARLLKRLESKSERQVAALRDLQTKVDAAQTHEIELKATIEVVKASLHASTLDVDRHRTRSEQLSVELANQAVQLRPILERSSASIAEATAVAERVASEKLVALEAELSAATRLRTEAELKAERYERVVEGMKTSSTASAAAATSNEEKLSTALGNAISAQLDAERAKHAAEQQQAAAAAAAAAKISKADMAMNELRLELAVEQRRIQTLQSELGDAMTASNVLAGSLDSSEQRQRALVSEKDALARRVQQDARLATERFELTKASGETRVAELRRSADAEVADFQRRAAEAEGVRDTMDAELVAVRGQLQQELAVAKEQLRELGASDADCKARLAIALQELDEYGRKEQALIAAAFEATEVAETYHNDYLTLASSLAHMSIPMVHNSA